MTALYYFSGTGNTFAAAKRIAALLESEAGDETTLADIAGLMRGEDAGSELSADRIVILFPAYAYGAPAIVLRFVRKFRFRARYIAVFVTYGTDPGGALAEVYGALGKNGSPPDFSGGIPSVENYIPIFGPQSKSVRERRLAAQRDASEKAARALISESRAKPRMFRPLSRFISMIFLAGRKHFVKLYGVSDKCSACGLCAKICPVGAIEIFAGRPVFSGSCEHCQSCFNRCPERALSYLRLRPGTPPYIHPES